MAPLLRAAVFGGVLAGAGAAPACRDARLRPFSADSVWNVPIGAAAVFAPADRYPALPRLDVISPFGNRDPEAIAAGISEMEYLLRENPLFFGGYKVLAFLLYKNGDAAGAARALRSYLDLHVEGAALAETQELTRALEKRGAWPTPSP